MMSSDLHSPESTDPETPGWLPVFGVAFVVLTGLFVFAGVRPSVSSVGASGVTSANPHQHVSSLLEPVGPAAVALRVQRARTQEASSHESRKNHSLLNKRRVFHRHMLKKLKHPPWHNKAR